MQHVSPPSHVSHPSCPALPGTVIFLSMMLYKPSLHGPRWTPRSSCCHTAPLLQGGSTPAVVGLLCHGVLGSCGESCAGAARAPLQLHLIVCTAQWDCRASTRGQTQMALMIGSCVLRGCCEGKIIMGLLTLRWRCKEYLLSGEMGKEENSTQLCTAELIWKHQSSFIWPDTSHLLLKSTCLWVPPLPCLSLCTAVLEHNVDEKNR